MNEKKILFIDDEDDFCFFVKLNLEKMGNYKVFTASRGKEGIRLAKQHKPDLIFLDIMMPEMDGGQVAEILLEDDSTSEIPVIFLTAVIKQEEVLENEGQIGGRDFIAKPVTPERIIEKIETYLADSKANMKKKFRFQQ
jgi:two-component system, OmpR family, alkaline phosphatase synthesis response regulator PhoP